MKSVKEQIERRIKKKTNQELVETIIKLKKKNLVAAKELARPQVIWPKLNLSEIEEKASKNSVLVCGKVLSSGDLSNVKKIVAWKASEKAKEKMKKNKTDFVEIVEEIKKNPELKDLELIK